MQNPKTPKAPLLEPLLSPRNADTTSPPPPSLTKLSFPLLLLLEWQLFLRSILFFYSHDIVLSVQNDHPLENILTKTPFSLNPV